MITNYENEDELNVEGLINALNDEENSSILELNSSKIKTIKNDLLQNIGLERDELKTFHKKLKEYRYINEPDYINYGCFIRWINLKNYDNLKLTNGGFVCKIELTKNNNVLVKMINYQKKFIVINMANSVIFQKLTNQEKILLKVMDYLTN
tara:strand:+ start:199 stop:651 length:453 start_codon:yes stop_codon:yes gene_type:complete